MSDQTGFEPAKHLTKVGGADYLEVKWRLAWLRDAQPDAAIETELVLHSEQPPYAVFRARASIPNGGSATGYGSEGADDFRDYIEKAETKAVGRALAALGFGTQFCPDFDFGADAGRIVDSPVDLAAGGQRRPSAAPRGGMGRPASEKQVNFAKSLAHAARYVTQDGHTDTERLEREFGVRWDGLTSADASRLIDALQAKRAPANQAQFGGMPEPEPPGDDPWTAH